MSIDNHFEFNRQASEDKQEEFAALVDNAIDTIINKQQDFVFGESVVYRDDVLHVTFHEIEADDLADLLHGLMNKKDESIAKLNELLNTEIEKQVRIQEGG